MYKNSKIIDKGKIISLSDGVVWADGLDSLMMGEIVNFKKDIQGLVFNLEKDKVGILVFENFEMLESGDVVESSGVVYQSGVSDKLLGRVIDPLGRAIDGESAVQYKDFYPVEKIAPGIVDRQPVRVPLQTGIKAIDAIVPIGRGQRELIIGDRTTGKTALAVDAIINQKDKDVISIYVAIGQKRAKVAQIIQKLHEHGSMKNTIVVAATASDSATFRYLAPYVGCTIGEYFMDKGHDVLLVYDDLTKHAWAYREISLLLKRPSGREAFPGDVFYLHSRLLERACKLSDKNGGGSITALPIIETQAGDVSAYIPTNVISITDGQIYLESDLFFAGVRPALNVGLSVSRVGGSAQVKAMKKVAGQMRLELSQYYELATFSQFSSDLDAETKQKIERGKRIVEVLKQPQYSPIPVEKQVLILYLVTKGFLDDVPVNLVLEFEKDFEEFSDKYLSDIRKSYFEKAQLTKKEEEKLHSEADKFIKEFFKKHLITKEDDKSKSN